MHSFSQYPQPQAAIRRKLLAAARMAKPAGARNGRALPRAWFMTDPKRTPHPERIVARLPPGFGVIYRHFGAKDRFEVGERLARICRSRRLVLLVSADPELARRIGADGVHWPEARLRRRSPAQSAPGSRPPRRTRAPAIARAARLGVDAAILSAVFESAQLVGGRADGGAALSDARSRRARLPVYALGGDHAAQRRARHDARDAAGWAAIDAVLSGWGD